MKEQLLVIGVSLLVGILAGYILKDRISPEIVNEIRIRKQKIKGDNGSIGVEQDNPQQDPKPGRKSVRKERKAKRKREGGKKLGRSRLS
jgi:hypothetical protein